MHPLFQYHAFPCHGDLHTVDFANQRIDIIWAIECIAPYLKRDRSYRNQKPAR